AGAAFEERAEAPAAARVGDAAARWFARTAIELGGARFVRRHAPAQLERLAERHAAARVAAVARALVEPRRGLQIRLDARPVRGRAGVEEDRPAKAARGEPCPAGL